MKNFKSLLSAVVLIFLTTQCSLFPWNTINPEPQPEPVVSDFYSVAEGDSVVITLDGNNEGSTGYGWRFNNRSGCVHVDSIGFNYVSLGNNGPNGEMICGGPGLEKWTFKGKAIGVDTLKFSFVRRWENDSIPPVEVKKVIIQVYPIPLMK